MENLHNYAGKQYAQWIHEQTSEGVAARQPCGGNLWVLQEITSKLVLGSIIVCSMGPSVARAWKLPDSAARGRYGPEMAGGD